MTKWLAVALVLVAGAAWGEHVPCVTTCEGDDDKGIVRREGTLGHSDETPEKQPYPCDNAETRRASQICFESVTNRIRPYCDAPTYGTMPRVTCWDYDAKWLSDFGTFATAKEPKLPKGKRADWLCVDEKNYEMFRCEPPEPAEDFRKKGNWLCLDESDNRLKTCSNVKGAYWSIIELPYRGD